jgi:hypothetical protein
MKSHYSILSAVVRPEIQEKISIGLLLVSSNEVYFQFSKTKLSAVRTLLDSSLYKYLNETIRQIDTAVSIENSNKKTLFANSDKNIQFSQNYLAYMNNYSNNLINFSAPVEIELTGNENLFNYLYNKYIDSTGLVQKKTKSVERVKEEFYPQIINYYNTNKEVTTNDIPNLPMSVNVDIIGKNELPVFGQIIDFERPIYNIRQDVAVLDFLMDAFEPGGTRSFMVGNEPDKTVYPKSHDAWNDLRKWNKLNYLPLDEIEQIKEYAEVHGVVPLF